MKRVVLFTLVILVALGWIAFIYRFLQNGKPTIPPQYYQNHAAPSAAAARFSHIVIILEENKPQGKIIGNASAPYINQLAKKYAVGTKYYAVTHPSLPNYLALTSGTTAGFKSDCNPPGNTCQANVSNIADRLEQAHKTWKMYAESMPQACYRYNSGAYAVKHNPFMYYPDISANKNRCASHVVPFSQFGNDLSAAGSLPDYSFISPNLCDDMHDCPIRTGDGWLSHNVPEILNSKAFTAQNSLLVIAWDEGDSGDNNVPVIFAGPAAKTGYTSSAYTSHYSLLRTIENNWNLKPLTNNDASAPVMTDLLK